MKLAIIGAGHVGSTLGQGWAKAGHDVRYGTRAPAAPDHLTPSEAAAWGTVVVLALPWSAAEAVVAGLGSLSGKTVIDCMNPIARMPEGIGLALGHNTSGGEQVQSWLPEARVVKTLNQVGAEIMADTSGFPVPPVQFMAGNDDKAKQVVATLLTDLGFDPLDAGGLTKARLLEPFALTWINQALMQGKGRDWAFGAMSRAGQ